MRIWNAGAAAALSTMIISITGPLAAQAWQQVASPHDASYDMARLDRARAIADSVGSGAVMLVHRGRVVAAFGDVARPFMAHSVRKSLLGGLMGIAEARGELQLDATLASLHVDDVAPLTSAELQATVVDLAAARSGVYHPAAYADQSQDDERPARGSHPHGTHFFYNNWDFNAAEHIVEQAGGKDLYQLFAERLARPIGMEDIDPSRDGLEVFEPSKSRLPAHTIRISARDLARFGELIRNGGKWGAQQVIPAAWIARSTTAISDLGEGAGYGLLWWTYAQGSLGDRYPVLSKHQMILARGTGGQGLFIIPALDLVVVHRGDTDNGRRVAGPPIWAIVEELAAATIGATETPPETTALAATPLRSQRPAPAPIVPTSMSVTERQQFVGAYVLGPNVASRVFEFGNRLFMNAEGMGETELIATSANEFVAPSERSIAVTTERDSTGRVTAFTVTVGGRPMRAVRK